MMWQEHEDKESGRKTVFLIIFLPLHLSASVSLPSLRQRHADDSFGSDLLFLLLAPVIGVKLRHMYSMFASGVGSGGDLILFLLVAPVIGLIACLLAGMYFAIHRRIRKVLDGWHEHHSPPPASPADTAAISPSSPTHPDSTPDGPVAQVVMPTTSAAG